MKVALLIQVADRRKGGAEAYTADLARALACRGHEVTVVAETGGYGAEKEAGEAGYKCLYVGANGRSRWGRLKDFLGRLREVYAHGGYDVVHAMLPVWRCDVYQPHAGLAADGLMTGHLKHPGWVARQFARVFNQTNPKRRGLCAIEREMMERGAWLLCFSEAMGRFARERMGVPAERKVMLMNGIDLGRFDPAVGRAGREEIRGRWQIKGEQRVALFVGNNWKLKGVGEAIEAIGRLRDPRLVLMIVGRGEAGPYRKLAAKWGVEERVIFAGLVSDPRGLYGAADFLLLPTRRDTCSLVVLEALVMGLPVVTTRQNGASDVITEGKQGLVVESGDVAGLCGALKVMMEEGRRKAMAAEALAMRTSLSFEEHVRRVEEVYGKVVEARTCSHGPSTTERQGTLRRTETD